MENKELDEIRHITDMIPEEFIHHLPQLCDLEKEDLFITEEGLSSYGMFCLYSGLTYLGTESDFAGQHRLLMTDLGESVAQFVGEVLNL